MAHAERAAFLVDAAEYFRRVREAMVRAERSIFIVGWDLRGDLRLVRDGAEDGMPVELAPLIDALVARNETLQVYVLNWDFSMIYALEREFFPRYRSRWRDHERVHFCLDGEHPVGASQHQKLVVIDDRVAFCGGIDLSRSRWDTPEHRPTDERRRGPDGRLYPPFHDVQMIVDGDAARALSDLARTRWARASDVHPVSAVETEGDPWPTELAPALRDVGVAVARTYPAYGGREEVREVEALYLDAIARARRFIYLENQFLTAHVVVQALARRLAEEGGPEVVAVLPEKTSGWLEQYTMDVLRARRLRDLREADRHGRLRVYCVRRRSDPPLSVTIHAKVCVVDDTIARVGSANLSNRSMGLDAECDLAVEAGDRPDHVEAIATFRRRLLAEHLDVSEAEVREAESRHDGLVDAIESLRSPELGLWPLSGEVSEEVDGWVPDSTLLDPERPIEPDLLFERMVGPEQTRPAYRRAARAALLVVSLLAMAALWRWTPLGDHLDVEGVTAVARWIEGHPLSPLLLLAAYVVAGFLVVPVTLLILATVAVFGPWLGSLYALLGAELSALATFGIGRLLGRDIVARLAGSRAKQLRRHLSERGVFMVVTFRLVPVAPFTVVNVAAGASAIRLRDFAVGNLLGILPGIAGMAFVADRFVAMLRDPSGATVVAALAVLVAVVAAGWGLRRWTERRRSREAG